VNISVEGNCKEGGAERGETKEREVERESWNVGRKKDSEESQGAERRDEKATKACNRVVRIYGVG
jgi:hypothetical protein